MGLWGGIYAACGGPGLVVFGPPRGSRGPLAGRVAHVLGAGVVDEGEAFKGLVQGAEVRVTHVWGDDGHHRGELLVELRGVQRACHGGGPGGGHLSRSQGGPVEPAEEGVRLDLAGVLLPRAQSVLRVPHQQVGQQVLGVVGDLGGEVELGLHDLLEHGLAVAAVERRQACDHLVQQRPQGPPVHRPAVPLSSQHLGRNVLGRAAEAVRPRGVVAHPLFREAEVGQPHVAVLVQKDVFGLQVAVNDVHFVHILQREGDLRCVEARPVLRKPPHLPQVEEQLPAGAVVQHQK
mmetsp:Transcript_15445/g.34065  ORF Transcript_15445/g.34065 Transcript_15445/m.34065 type:complete len:291 (-) Transcript_15445:1126-1998(-)